MKIKLQHIFILLIVFYGFYLLINKCKCNNGFSVGIPEYGFNSDCEPNGSEVDGETYTTQEKQEYFSHVNNKLYLYSNSVLDHSAIKNFCTNKLDTTVILNNLSSSRYNSKIVIPKNKWSVPIDLEGEQLCYRFTNLDTEDDTLLKIKDYFESKQFFGIYDVRDITYNGGDCTTSVPVIDINLSPNNDSELITSILEGDAHVDFGILEKIIHEYVAPNGILNCEIYKKLLLTPLKKQIKEIIYSDSFRAKFGESIEICGQSSEIINDILIHNQFHMPLTARKRFFQYQSQETMDDSHIYSMMIKLKAPLHSAVIENLWFGNNDSPPHDIIFASLMLKLVEYMPSLNEVKSIIFMLDKRIVPDEKRIIVRDILQKIPSMEIYSIQNDFFEEWGREAPPEIEEGAAAVLDAYDLYRVNKNELLKSCKHILGTPYEFDA